MSRIHLLPVIHIEQILPSLTWRIRQEAMYKGQPLTKAKLDDDLNGIHFGLYLNHELTGVVSLFIKGSEAQFRKFAILPAFQQQGLGRKLMKELIDYTRLQKLTKLWCNARINAIEFYLKFGFVETGQPYQVAGIDYIKMNLKL